MASLVTRRESGVDVARVGELAQLLGVERLGELIDILDVRLNQVILRFNEQPGAVDLIDSVHQSNGSASSLGFPRLAGLLRQLETLLRKAAKEVAGGALIQADQQAPITRNMSNVRAELEKARSSVRQITKVAAGRAIDIGL